MKLVTRKWSTLDSPPKPNPFSNKADIKPLFKHRSLFNTPQLKPKVVYLPMTTQKKSNSLPSISPVKSLPN